MTEISLVIFGIGFIILSLGYGTIQTSATSDTLYKFLRPPVDKCINKIYSSRTSKHTPRKIVGITYSIIGIAIITLGLLIPL